MPIREKSYECGKYLEDILYPISKVEQKKSRAKKKKREQKRTEEFKC